MNSYKTLHTDMLTDKTSDDSMHQIQSQDSVDESPSPPRKAAKLCQNRPIPRPIPKPCYLCVFAEEAVCVQYTRYIMNESSRTSRAQIAQLIAEDVNERETQAGRSPEGATTADIERHIATHMLQPSIKIPEIIRELDDVRRLLRGSITSVDPETGNSVIDTGNVSLYLKVIRELQQVYKIGDPSKLAMGNVVITGGANALNTDV
jgi:hypothetical protein